MKKILVLLILVVAVGAILRFYRLGDVPVGLHRDEAFLGYNAYSIAKTGKDMSGNFLPMHLESFIYSPAGYSYFSIPFIKFFGLSAFSVRFASALFGSITVLVTYFLVKELFGQRATSFALLASFFLAIAPWHINLSRTATENTIVVFFISLGILLFTLWTKKSNFLLLLSSFFAFGLTLLIYQAPRAFLPLFIPLLILTFLKRKIDKRFLFATALFIITVVLPLLFIFSSKQLSLRIRTVSLFATQESQLTINEQHREDGVSDVPLIVTRLSHNKLVNYSGQFLQNYFSHFSYDFLFTDKGLPIRYKIPNTGLLYLFELPFLLLGVWFLLRNGKREGIFLITWITLAPVGSALTFDDVPNLQRTLLIFPALSIVIAKGIHESFLLIKKSKFLKPIYVMTIIIILYNSLFYLHQYYVHQVVHRPWLRHEGYKELVESVIAFLPKYKKAIITNRESAPTIFFLFYGKYDPVTFQQETKQTTMRDFDRIDFGRYEFSEEECPIKEFEDIDKATGEKSIKVTGQEGVLYVDYGTCKISDRLVTKLGEITRSDGSLVFRILGFTGEK